MYGHFLISNLDGAAEAYSKHFSSPLSSSAAAFLNDQRSGTARTIRQDPSKPASEAAAATVGPPHRLFQIALRNRFPDRMASATAWQAAAVMALSLLLAGQSAGAQSIDNVRQGALTSPTRRNVPYCSAVSARAGACSKTPTL